VTITVNPPIVTPPTNLPPTVNAGPNETITLPASASLNGAVERRRSAGRFDADQHVDEIQRPGRRRICQRRGRG